MVASMPSLDDERVSFAYQCCARITGESTVKVLTRSGFC